MYTYIFMTSVRVIPVSAVLSRVLYRMGMFFCTWAGFAACTYRSRRVTSRARVRACRPRRVFLASAAALRRVEPEFRVNLHELNRVAEF